MKQPLLILTVVALGAAPARAWAAKYPTCGVINPLASRRTQPGTPLAPGLVRVEARQARILGHGVTRLMGDVHARRDGEELFADRASYDRASGLLDASGNIVFLGQFVDVSGRTARLDLTRHHSVVHHAHFYLRQRQGRGSAAEIQLHGNDLGILTNVDYTSCPVGHRDWVMQSRRMVLDRKHDEGTAHDVTLWFKGVPILYTPWLSFPLTNRRKSGFLAPSFGVSGNTGADLATPYYFNLAPNQDATVTPRIMTRRGIQVQNQYRYLTPGSRGELNLDYLPHDRVYGSRRYLLGVQDHTRLSRHWSAGLHYQDVSDPYYFQDLGGTLAASSTRLLDRNADIEYSGQAWMMQLQAQDFQLADPTLTGADLPYQRLPRLLVRTRYPPSLGPLHWDLYGEAVRFAHHQQTRAERFDTELGLSLPLDRPGFYVHPRVAYRYTAYDLASSLRKADPQLTRNHPARGTPIASLDTQLFFERRFRLGGHALVQTLQPRLYYLYVPYRKQGNLPVLDTTVPQFTFPELFSENRFTGTDRLGDANQVTTMLGSQIIDPASGRQYGDASIGQIYYFQPHRVTLPGETVSNRGSSDLLGRARVDLSQTLSALGDIQWDPRSHRTVRSMAGVRYHDGSDRIVNLAYRQIADNTSEPLRQTDVSTVWPVGQRWSAIARWNYSLREHRTLEALAGMQYESCCWAVQVVARRYISGVRGHASSGLYFQLQLKGLTRLGNGVGALLEHDILGYHSD